MERNLLWRTLMVLGLIAGALVYLYPSYVFFSSPEELSEEEWHAKMPGWMPEKKVNLGLDLQGGIHLVLGVDVQKAIDDRLDRLAEDIFEDMKEKGVVALKSERVEHTLPEGYRPGDGRPDTPPEILVVLASEDDATTFEDEILDNYSILTLEERTDGGKRLVLELRSKEAAFTANNAVEQAIKTIRNRVDSIGVSEPTIAKRGDTSVLVELPGLKDPERAKSIIGRTAQLEFKMVDDESTIIAGLSDLPEKVTRETESVRAPGDTRVVSTYLKAPSKELILPLLEGKLPPDRELAFQKSVKGETETYRTFILHRKAGITGDYLTTASLQRNSRTGRPYVALSFDRKGAEIFDHLTKNNVNRRMAIVLDGMVESAPNIQERISGGNASITLGGGRDDAQMMQEARDLTLVLRAGALPAPVMVREERQVGEQLGKVSVERGRTAFIAGLLAVMLFMVVYYRVGGLVADLALTLNMLFMGAAMAMLQATLTLPGVAGIVLTVGMAVDANVIIFERVREELRMGKTPAAAIQAGYGKALSSIFDANITTLIAGFVLWQYGSGPLRGFAVTLIIGILSSMFTAIVVTRLVFDAMLARKRNVERLAI